MTKPKVEPCILSLSVRTPSELQTWWLLTTLRTTVSVALFSISHCVTWSKLVGRWEGGVLAVGSAFLFVILLWLWTSYSSLIPLSFSSFSSLFPFIDFILLDFSFLIPSSCRLLQLLRKTRKINLYLCFFCCHQKYKTSGKKATPRFYRLSFMFLFLPFFLPSGSYSTPVSFSSSIWVKTEHRICPVQWTKIYTGVN